MSSEIEPGEISVSSGPGNKYTQKISSRQEGNLRLLKGSLRLASSIGIATASLLSPVDSPLRTTASSEDKCEEVIGVGFTPLHGDCDPFDLTFQILLDTKTGADMSMAQRLVKNAFTNLPPEFSEKTTILLRKPEDLGCVPNIDCNPALVVKENNNGNALLKTIGRAAQETAVLSKSRFDYLSSLSASLETRIPSLYTGSLLFLPNPEGGRQSLDWHYELAFLHEAWGHGVGGIPDNEGHGDVMDHMATTLSFSPQHLQILKERLALGIQRYAAPSVEGKFSNPAALATQSRQSSDFERALYAWFSVDTLQALSEVTPYNNDGAGAADIIATPFALHAWGETGRRLPPPSEWYGFLPDMTYTWRLRTSHLAEPLKQGDPRWGQREIAPGVFVSVPGAEYTTEFRTPKRDSSKIVLQPNAQADRLNPTLVWDNGDKDVYYYEVQVSKDPNFNTDPATASSPVYWELRHGGVTNPKNSYTIPSQYPLEPGATYYWRVRPRIQGDGTPVKWSKPAEFNPASNAKVKLTSENLADFDYGNGIIGPSQTDLDKANPQPEPIKPSPLARVITREYANGEYGEILIPEQGAKEVRSSNPPVDVVTGVQYKAFIDSYNNRRRRLARLAA